jgi:hypothetical protein
VPDEQAFHEIGGPEALHQLFQQCIIGAGLSLLRTGGGPNKPLSSAKTVAAALSCGWVAAQRRRARAALI